MDSCPESCRRSWPSRRGRSSSAGQGFWAGSGTAGRPSLRSRRQCNRGGGLQRPEMGPTVLEEAVGRKEVGSLGVI